MLKSKTDSYRSDLKCLLSDRLRAGSWLPLFTDDLSQLTIRQAVVLGIIANLAKERAEPTGWLLLTPAYLRSGPLALSDDQQDAALEALGRLGLIDVTYRGRPAKRHVRINLTALRRLASGRTLTNEDDDFDF
jgi:hypothetical protein